MEGITRPPPLDASQRSSRNDTSPSRTPHWLDGPDAVSQAIERVENQGAQLMREIATAANRGDATTTLALVEKAVAHELRASRVRTARVEAIRRRLRRRDENPVKVALAHERRRPVPLVALSRARGHARRVGSNDRASGSRRGATASATSGRDGPSDEPPDDVATAGWRSCTCRHPVRWHDASGRIECVRCRGLLEIGTASEQLSFGRLA